ncbi:peroxiredoxin family protein [Spirosoma rhododendri]|uniref:Redoxin family protein n=1 Tax=Spirosoma rhododendri TaxID=2728024 RepID=A0A7L5DW20_9BACT|nr:redoxin family protein [Spirosoma rhododendri]QJD80177.1 redoxin family protein [Spirosoma rhododendri]
MKLLALISLAVAVSAGQLAIAQVPAVETRTGGISYTHRIDDKTIIIDKATGERIPASKYEELTRRDRNGYHLEEVMNEYGQPASYLLRPTTSEERETHRFYNRGDENRPKVGAEMPLFVMKGIDNKEYRSTELKGQVVVLSFWISTHRPFWNLKHVAQFAEALQPFQTGAGFMSLGIFSDSAEEIADVLKTQKLPFVAVPNAYGFNRKFGVGAGSTCIVVDRDGKVAAFIDGADYAALKTVLERLNRK